MTDMDIITEYRQIVIEYHLIRQRIAWNIQHGLPVLRMPEQLHELCNHLLRFEDILDRIPDRKTRIAIRCRYALGLNDYDTAAVMGLSAGSVSRILNRFLRSAGTDPDDV